VAFIFINQSVKRGMAILQSGFDNKLGDCGAGILDSAIETRNDGVRGLCADGVGLARVGGRRAVFKVTYFQPPLTPPTKGEECQPGARRADGGVHEA